MVAGGGDGLRLSDSKSPVSRVPLRRREGRRRKGEKERIGEGGIGKGLGEVEEGSAKRAVRAQLRPASMMRPEC